MFKINIMYGNSNFDRKKIIPNIWEMTLGELWNNVHKDFKNVKLKQVVRHTSGIVDSQTQNLIIFDILPYFYLYIFSSIHFFYKYIHYL